VWGIAHSLESRYNGGDKRYLDGHTHLWRQYEVGLMERRFTLEYWLDDDWFVGKLREVPGVFSQGESLAELEENIREAYQLMVEDQEESLPVGVQTKELVFQL
jgi:predicted RNase H-like HicB family nuclease